MGFGSKSLKVSEHNLSCHLVPASFSPFLVYKNHCLQKKTNEILDYALVQLLLERCVSSLPMVGICVLVGSSW